MGNDNAFISRRGTLSHNDLHFSKSLCLQPAHGSGRMPKLKLNYHGPELSHCPTREDTPFFHAGSRAERVKK